MRTPELRYARQAVVFGYGAVVLAAAAGLVSFTGAPRWVSFIAAGLAVSGLVSGGLGKAAEWRERRTRVARERRDAVGSLLRLPVSPVSALSSTQFGATPTRYTNSGSDPYVTRTVIDDELDALLEAGPPFLFILLHGDAKAGKSRTVAEALWRHRATASAVLPRDGESLAALSRIEPPLVVSDAVVVLDDLSATDLEHLTGTVLEYWGARAVVIATMTTTRYRDVLRTGSEAPGAARASLYRARVLELPFELTTAEQAVAQECYPEEEFTGADTVSIGEVLVGGEELVRKLRAGRDDCPAGVAVARAAIDARRAGLMRPIMESELWHLFPLYLAQVKVGLPATTESFQSGLTWTGTPVTSQVAILHQPFDEEWLPLDYLVEAEAGLHGGTARPIPAFLWDELLDITFPFDAVGIADAAASAGVKAVSRAAAERGLRYEPHATLAAFLLAELEDDPDRAVALYRRAMSADNAEIASRAALQLAVLLIDLGKLQDAESLFEQEMDSPFADNAAAAAFNLGVLRMNRDDTPGAMAAYQQAISFGDTMMAGEAKNNLAILHNERGDRREAERLLHDVIDNHPRNAPRAWGTLSAIQRREGDLDAAEASVRQAITLDDSDIADMAYTDLAHILIERDDVAGLGTLADDLIARGAATTIPAVCLEVGSVFAEDEPDRALALFRAVLRTNSPEHSADAAHRVGMVLADQEDFVEAEAMFRIAADSGHPDHAPEAAFRLAGLLAQRGDFETALARHRQVQSSGHPVSEEAAPGMWLVLVLLRRQEEAAALLEDMTTDGREAVVSFVRTYARPVKTAERRDSGWAGEADPPGSASTG